MGMCRLCGGLGLKGGCPKCNATPRPLAHMSLVTQESTSDIIPHIYQGVMWNKPESENAREKEFDNSLEKIHNSFLNGSIPKFSVFLAAPPKSGKNLFAYSCMQTSIAQGFTVAPLLSTADWRRLLKVSQTNPFYKLYGKYQWDKLINLDVVFLYIEHSEEHNSDIPLLKSIYDTRSGFGLSTFVISDYRLNDLVPRWDSDAYTSIYNSNDNRDYLRYPVILHRM